jgi:hypothetical protein
MKRLGATLTTIAFTALLSFLPSQGSACSLASCIDHGIEVNRNFVVSIKHQGKPIAGVMVRITGGAAVERFSGLTTSTGEVIVDLPPGDYWLDAFWGSARRINVSTWPNRPQEKQKAE